MTLIDMPLNSLPPTTTVENLMTKVRAADGQCWVDVGFHGGLIPNNTAHLKPLVDAGVRSFKGFLIESGIDEFPAVGPEHIEAALLALADSPTTVMFHAEMVPPSVTPVGSGAPYTGPLTSYQTHLDSRTPDPGDVRHRPDPVQGPPRARPGPAHRAPLSRGGHPDVARGPRPGRAHHGRDLLPLPEPRGRGGPEGDTRYKSAPPSRGRANQALLWDELSHDDGQGVINTVVSDHSPWTPDQKLIPDSLPVAPHSHAGEDGDFFGAWGGASSLGLGLSILWTEAADHGASIEDIVRWTSTNTARQVGLEQEKGDIDVGFDGDIVVFDDEAEFDVNKETMFFRNEVSPFDGKTLKGVVERHGSAGRRLSTAKRDSMRSKGRLARPFSSREGGRL